MREIKFRAKRVDNGEWAYGGLIEADDFCIIDQHNELYTERDYNFRGDTHFFQLSGVMCDKKTVGQFTGLCDSKGKEIYEGDIFTVNGKFPKLIEYRQDYAGFCMANLYDLTLQPYVYPWQQIRPDWWNDYKREIEIIGNRYDNPDLMDYDKD